MSNTLKSEDSAFTSIKTAISNKFEEFKESQHRKKMGEQFLKACRCGDFDKVKELIDNKVNISFTNRHGDTGALLALVNGHSYIVELIEESVYEEDTIPLEQQRKTHTTQGSSPTL